MTSSANSPAVGPVRTPGHLGKAFWRLWAASTAANLSDGVHRVAFPLLAITLTRNPVLVSAVAAATTLPWLVVGPLAGLAVDRWDRLRLLWIVNAARVLVVVVLVVALVANRASIALLIGAALFLGVGETFVDNATQALVPRTVAPARLERANSRLYGAQVITGQFLGQGMTGALFALAVLAPFAVGAAALLTATIFTVVLSTTTPETPRTPNVSPSWAQDRTARTSPGRRLSAGTQRDSTAAGSFATEAGRAFTEIAQGIRWLLSQRLLRSLWLTLAALGFASGAFWGVIALYATQVLHLGPTGFGLMLAVGACGSLLGSQIAPGLRTRMGTPGAMYLGVGLVVVSGVGLALTRSAALAATLMVLNGVGVLVWNVVGVSLRQRVVPDVLLGRVSAAFSMAAVGAATAGALVAGTVAASISLPTVFWMSATTLAVVAIFTAPGMTRE